MLFYALRQIGHIKLMLLGDFSHRHFRQQVIQLFPGKLRTALLYNFKQRIKRKYFAEISDVLSGEKVGRKDDSERILSYNIGLGLHDVLFAAKIYEKVTYLGLMDIPIIKESEKFWI